MTQELARIVADVALQIVEASSRLTDAASRLPPDKFARELAALHDVTMRLGRIVGELRHVADELPGDEP